MINNNGFLMATAKTKSFLRRYDLFGSLDKVTKDQIPAEVLSDFELEDEWDESPAPEFYRLKGEVLSELKRTYALFISEEYAEERNESTLEAAKKEAVAAICDSDNLAKIVRDKFDMSLKDIMRNTDEDGPKITVGAEFSRSPFGDGASGIVINLSLESTDESEEKRIETDCYYHAWDESQGIEEEASEWSWLAWLGIEESPFFDRDFVDAYLEDRKSLWFSEVSELTPDDCEKIVNACTSFFVNARQNFSTWMKAVDRFSNKKIRLTPEDVNGDYQWRHLYEEDYTPEEAWQSWYEDLPRPMYDLVTAAIKDWEDLLRQKSG